jgi:6-phosphofructokinase 1
VVVAEGAKFAEGKEVLQEEKLDAFGHVRLGGIGQELADRIEKLTGFETRVTVLGHLQRGGSPTTFDRVLGTRFGIKAVELVEAKKFNRMVSLDGNKIIDVDIQKVAEKIKTLDMEFFKVAEEFFG